MDQINTRDLRSSIKGKGQKRQVILSGRKGKVYSDFIERQTDTKVKIVASQEDPLIVSLADGFNDLGQVDHTKSFTQDITDIEVAPNATNFILMEKDDAGLYTTQVTKVEPIYGTLISSDRENKVCASFNAPSGSKTFNDPYGNFFRFYGGSEITSSYQIHGGNTAYFNGAVGSYAICESPHLNTSDLDQWTLEFDVKFNTFSFYQILLDTNVGSGGNTPIYIAIDTDSKLHLYLGDGAGTWLLTNLIIDSNGFSSGFNTSQVYNIVILFNKNNVKAYVNGILTALSNIFVNNWTYRTPYFQNFVLGHRGDYTTLPFSGYVANFQFWPYAKYSNYPTSYLRTPGANVFALSYTQCVPDTPKPQRYIKNGTIAYFDFELPEGSTDITDYFGNKMITSWFGSDAVHQPRVASTYPAKFGTRSLVKLGSANFANRAEFKIDMGDMTLWSIEFWHYYSATTGAYTILYTDTDYSISIGKTASPANNLQVLIGNGGSWITTMTSSSAMNAGSWHHIALTFDGQVYKMFLNGSLQGSYTSSVPFLVYKPGYLTLGHLNSTLNCPVDCAYDDFAVFNYCKYTTNFTPPTEPLSNTLEPMYYYDIKKAKMYKGFYNQLVEQSAIFLGEVKTLGSKIEEIVSYSVNAETGPIPFYGPPNDSTAASTYVKHNIGSTLCKGKIDYTFNRNFEGFLPGDKFSDILVHENSYSCNPLFFYGRNLVGYSRAEFIVIRKVNGIALGIGSGFSNSVGSAEIFVERAW